MKFDMRAASIVASLFFSGTLSATEAFVLESVKSELPASGSVQDRIILQKFLFENAENLSTETVLGISSVVTKDKEEKLDLLKSLSEVTGDFRFMGSQPECTDAR